MKTKKKNETGGTTKIKPKKKDKKNVHCFFLYFRVFFVVVVGGQLVEYARGTPSPSRFHPKLEKPMLRPFAVALNASAAANSFFFLKKKITSIPQQSKAKFAPVPHLRIMQMSHRHRYANELGEIGPFH